MSKKRKHKRKDAMPRHSTVQPRTVENPDFTRDHAEQLGNPRYITASVNVKESAVETLYARKFLGTGQKMAADKFRDLWEAAGGKTSSIDYTMDRVDGGGSDVLAARITAAHELKRCRVLLGQRGYELIQAVCGEGKALTEISPHKRERLTMADNLRADLDDLAVMWRFQTRQRRAG